MFCGILRHTNQGGLNRKKLEHSTTPSECCNNWKLANNSGAKTTARQQETHATSLVETSFQPFYIERKRQSYLWRQNEHFYSTPGHHIVMKLWRHNTHNKNLTNQNFNDTTKLREIQDAKVTKSMKSSNDSRIFGFAALTNSTNQSHRRAKVTWFKYSLLRHNA